MHNRVGAIIKNYANDEGSIMYVYKPETVLDDKKIQITLAIEIRTISVQAKRMNLIVVKSL